MKRLRSAIVVLLLAACALAVSSDLRAGPHVHLEVKLLPGPGRLFLVGKPPRLVGAPMRLTVHLKHAGKTQVRLFGLHPGGKVMVGAKGKPFKLHVKRPGGHVKVGPGGFKMKGKKKGGKWKF
jgi:hypothetical protein